MGIEEHRQGGDSVIRWLRIMLHWHQRSGVRRVKGVVIAIVAVRFTRGSARGRRRNGAGSELVEEN